MKKLIVITILLSMLLLPNIAYLYNKTIWKDQTDCMIQYIQNHYPNGCTYIIFWASQHIDKCWLANDYMVETKKINGCFINDWVISAIFNIPYCYMTLFYEKLLWLELNKKH